jgi:hypothetical protein
MMKSIIVSMLLVVSGIANAQVMGEIVAGGNGCKKGDIGIAQRGTDAVIQFDAFKAQAGRAVGKNIDRVSCNLAIPIHVPQGYKVIMKLPEIQGFADISRKGRATIDAEVFATGARGPKIRKQIKGPISSKLSIVDFRDQQVESDCGADMIVRLNLSAIVQSSSQVASLFVDEINLIDLIQIRTCR